MTAVERNELDRLELIGTGGQASVYALGGQFGDDNLIFKEYGSGQQVDGEALARVVALRSSLSESNLERLDLATSWPRNLVVDGGDVVGVLLPRAPAHFWIDVRGVEKLREIQFLTHGDRAVDLGLSLPTPEQRLCVSAALARILELFESLGVVHGDLSFKNVLWSVEPYPEVYLLDCDAVIVDDAASALPQVTTPLWTDPRIGRGEVAQPDTDSDRLGLALTAYRTYFQARGDFTGGLERLQALPDSPPTDAPVQSLFERSLTESAPRASASEWSPALLALAASLPELIASRMPQTHSLSVDLVGDDFVPGIAASGVETNWSGGAVPGFATEAPAATPPPVPQEPPLIVQQREAQWDSATVSADATTEIPQVVWNAPEARAPEARAPEPLTHESDSHADGDGRPKLFVVSAVAVFAASAAGGYLLAGAFI